MQESWRWFGPDDSVSLENVIQAGATGVVTALDHIPTGEAWPLEDILDRKTLIEAHGLEWAVVEGETVALLADCGFLGAGGFVVRAVAQDVKSEMGRIAGLGDVAMHGFQALDLQHLTPPIFKR